ncbi:Ig-like and fibronectin type-III domain-containing protein 1 [Artemia franciscana]|uniref:Ig-like and fibronectin type-III domain-containing protein 1 n=1 Tax=Artemia franciscana TaxID=6661 RepID=UPI0032DAF882
MKILLFWIFIIPFVKGGLPSLRDNFRLPVHAHEGEDALVTCVVRNLGENTLLWRKQDGERRTSKVLTAGPNRVTSDRRFSVMHNEAPAVDGNSSSGGDVWVLVIRDVKASDAGIYVCEVNSNPILRSFHTLEVISISLQPPGSLSTFSNITLNSDVNLDHEFTECCRDLNVSDKCLGFCNLRKIIDGQTGEEPFNCESDFKQIVRCMADGRNHVPCCLSEGIPDICQDICRGEYSIPTDDLKSHVSCSQYTEQTLACIADGIAVLPGPPTNVHIEAISDRSIRVEWSPPIQKEDTITKYWINISGLRAFDDNREQPAEGKNTKTDVMDKKTDGDKLKFFQKKVDQGVNSTIISDLEPFTMYEISVQSVNKHGTSLPSQHIRTLTLTPQSIRPSNGKAPELPDIRSCCSRKGVYHQMCVDKFCDPVKSGATTLPELMICAPWAKESFSCLANEIDHSACCKARGLPPICVELCSGNITSRVDFNHFKCIQYMDDLSNCVLQGFGVLPSEPRNLEVSNISPNFAIFHWNLPKVLGDTVTSYNLYFRQLQAGKPTYKAIPHVHDPFILENLESGREYEVYVRAVNDHGVSDPSSRILFKTEKESVLEIEEEEDNSGYNVTSCCVQINVNPVCLPLCSYSAKMSDLKTLAPACGREFNKLLRCGAGGRDHKFCCARRGVPSSCQGLCTGHVSDDVFSIAAACLPFLGNAIQCFEEGAGYIPSPPYDIHATQVEEGKITLRWTRPAEGNVSMYSIYFHEVPANASGHDVDVSEWDGPIINTTEVFQHIEGLAKNKMYSFYVIATNDYGSSLPSAVVTLNITNGENVTAKGVPSSPTDVGIMSRGADYLTVSWHPPRFIHPTDTIVYNIYYRPVEYPKFLKWSTDSLSYKIDELQSNVKYIIYVTASSEYGESRPSETLITWTDPSYAPILEAVTIHPTKFIREGGSMTIVCGALGNPMPTVEIYVGGKIISSERTRYLVTIISNVTRDMNEVSCYAENGIGTAAQASRRVVISRRPHIKAPMLTFSSLGDEAVIECEVDSYPEANITFSYDMDGEQIIASGGRYRTQIEKLHEDIEDSPYTSRLYISNVSKEDEQVYYCNAVNTFGSFAHASKLTLRDKAVPVTDVAQCCRNQNISSSCMVACTLFLDIDSVIDNPACINDFHKLMRCAADGSDHRSCCSQWGVPRRCLDWCRGEAVTDTELCALSYTQPIVSCFYEGRDRIPGPPTNIKVQVVSSGTAQISWDPPLKNPGTVELYRVFWRPVGSAESGRNDTKEKSITINDLKDGVAYELVLKAGNHYGISKLTEPIKFSIDDSTVIYFSSAATAHQSVNVAVAVIMSLLIITALLVAGYMFYRRRIAEFSSKIANGISFSNPGYGRNTDTVQIIHSEINTETTDPPGRSRVSTSTEWREETLEAPSAFSSSNEVQPTVYEELRLGTTGAGFKRLK